MPQTLAEWGKQTAPRLGRIQDCAERAEYYVDEIIHAMSMLKTRPDFTTKAEASLKSLEKKILDAILSYHELPVEK